MSDSVERLGRTRQGFERLPFVGGLTSTIESNGFKFDLGPTFSLYPRILDEILAAAGTRLDPQYRIIFGQGGKIDPTARIDAMEKEIAGLATNDAPGFRRFLQENRVKLERMEPCLKTPYLGWTDLFRRLLLEDLGVPIPLPRLIPADNPSPLSSLQPA